MLFSVIIPTYNRYPALLTCLKALDPAVQNFPATDYEVIVSDDTPEAICQKNPAPDCPWVRSYAGPRRGPASNRNNGVRQSKGEWIIFIDDDCIPGPNLLRGYREGIANHPEFGILEGRTVPDRPRERMDEEAPVTDEGGFLWSCNFAIRRDVFEKMNGFCEVFPYATMEDVDFRQRLAEMDLHYTYVPEAEAVHPWRPIPVSFKTLEKHVVSIRILFLRHPELRPSFSDWMRNIFRANVKPLLMDGPRYRFRGVGRWALGRLGSTVIDLMLAFESLGYSRNRPADRSESLGKAP